MKEVQLYASAHADPAHIREFFEKNLLRENEAPIAFFDGIFYAAKNERVGGLAFHDYLIFSDQSIYLWARGIHKDVLDRFPIGVVSASAKPTDEGFAAINLAISKPNSEPICLIFDVVPIDEAEKLVALHFAIEAEIEKTVGKNFDQRLPKDVAQKLVEIARKHLPLKSFFIYDKSAQEPAPVAEPEPPPNAEVWNGTIIYGDDMLSRIKRYRAGNVNEFRQSESRKGEFRQNEFRPPYSNGMRNGGYDAEFLRNEPRGRFGPPPFGPPPMPDLSGLFSKFDMVSLKRAEAAAKDILSNIPERYREQAKKDLAQMPERLKESLNALNELITNLAENPQAQNVVIQTIATAVKNDGLLGAMLKAMSLAKQTAEKAVSPDGFASTAPPQSEGETSAPPADEQPVERKKKIKIRVE
ncbi:MAG: hypothetical protein NZM06_10255 [Chloroherpetonaceae bacterium]|nr:hypothetical protein [Chloroherpetonaceae bacterium]MDW8438685.1 hypothetical protein [Chloroherpetonaceae bacterium]